MAAPKFGTLVPNRIFVGGISASTSEAELTQLFSAYGNVKATKIISDRAGVSKGYGFVTFETDEEARRLQQESECIILRERKLNIAPAIKKQPFNRSYEGGSGSPPAVPTSTYYYTNGMGLAYQSGLTFYNAGATPGTPIATPPDSTAIYHSSSIFGPQPPSGHQSFPPMVYSCPTPSLYMPQQFQYPPMAYEPYYAAPSAGSGLPLCSVYPTSTGINSHEQQVQNNGCIAGTSVANSTSVGGANGTNASHSSAHTSLLPPSSHFYAPPSAPPPSSHHHQPLLVSGPIPPPPLDHLYHSFAATGPSPQSQHQTINIGDQQLLLYTTDLTNCQQLAVPPDGQASSQEVQIYAAGLQAQSRYYEQQMSHQQQLVGQRRFPGIGQSTTPGRKLPGCGFQSAHSEHLRRPKSKVNSMTQGGAPCKMEDDHCVGGGGDATGPNMVNMLPMTPPSTPRTRSTRTTIDSIDNTVKNNTNSINDTCRQIQALAL